jgi:hypothetical protein
MKNISPRTTLHYLLSLGDENEKGEHSDDGTTNWDFIEPVTHQPTFSPTSYTYAGELFGISNYGGSGNDVLNSVSQTSDGGVIASGYSTSTDGDLSGNSGAADFVIAKFDKDGEKTWLKNYGGSGNDVFVSAIQTSDGNIYAVGNSNSNDGDVGSNKGAYDFIIAKFDEDGNKIWIKNYGGTGHDRFESIVQAGSNSFVVVGYSASSNGDLPGNKGNNDCVSAMFDADGNKVWVKNYGASTDDRFRSVVSAGDGSFVAVGFKQNIFQGSYTAKFSSEGNIIWEHSYKNPDSGTVAECFLYSVVQTTDGNFVAVGSTRGADTGSGYQFDIMKIKSDGTLSWRKTYGGNKDDHLWSANQVNDGGLIVVGYSTSSDEEFSNSHEKNDCVVAKLDKDGNKKWINTYGGSEDDYFYSSTLTTAGGLITVGSSASNNGDIPGKKGSNDFIISVADNSNDSNDFGLPVADSDGDGLLDRWETEGIKDELGNVILDLPAMGANPKKKDLFVEVDWMVKPAWRIGIIGEIVLRPKHSFAPSHEALKKVAYAFWQHDINLHIDAGPDSIDYVTDKKWGTLSRGNEIDYTETLDDSINSNKYAQKTYAVANASKNGISNFEDARRPAFRYAIFVDRLNKKGNTGVACAGNETPVDGLAFPSGAQCFVVAQGDVEGHNENSNNDIATAGTFMHELGHTLGLGHGGGDHERYKPNYLSIMNYSFQISGLLSSNSIDYSNTKLPDLSETSLDEKRGVDPDGLTLWNNTKTKWYITKGNKIETKTQLTNSDNGHSIDFDGLDGIDEDFIVADINRARLDNNDDGKVDSNDVDYGVLLGHRDWDEFKYISAQMDNPLTELEAFGDVSNPVECQELTFEEALETGNLGSLGAGSVNCIGPYTFISNQSNQNLFVNINNLSTEETTFTLKVSSAGLVPAYSNSVFVPASITTLSGITVPVPVVANPLSGNYTVTCILSYPGRDDVVAEIPVNVYDPTKEEMDELKDVIDSGEISIPDVVAEQYLELVSQINKNIPKVNKVMINGATSYTHMYKASGANKTLAHKVNVDASPTANKAVVWSLSGAKGVASVNSSTGLVTFTGKEGTVTLTATSVLNPSMKHSKVIKVVRNVTKIRTPISTVYLQQNKKLLLPVALDDGSVSVASALKYKSSNTKILTVDGKGTLKAVKKIKKATKVTVTITAANGKSSKVTVYVVPKATTSKGFSISGTPTKLQVGKTALLKIKFKTPKATTLKVTYASSNNKILTVDKAGRITPVKEGKALVKIKVGTKTVSTKKIQVMAPVSKLKVSKSNVSVKKGNTLALKVTAFNSVGKSINAGLTWKTSNKKIVTVDKKGNIRGLQKGTATITSMSLNGKKVIIKVMVI